MAERPTSVEIGLNAAIVAVSDNTPRILVTRETAGEPEGLPYGPFDPTVHRTMEMSLRDTVERQTALGLGYIEQLYTFGDRGRQHIPGEKGPHLVSVGYLALTRMDPDCAARLEATGAHWRDWYGFLPWEDWRGGRPALIDRVLMPALTGWAEAGPGSEAAARRLRLKLAFGNEDFPFDEERALERYELLYEAGLVEEAVADGHAAGPAAALGIAMRFDHRRIAATALARLRAKIKYRPVIFELMPPEFTLTELQATVEAISGRHLHKQNFRRLVEGAELVEPTGGTATATGGRPAALFRFRRRIVGERPAPGLKLGGRG
ncbi:NAD regulator [Rhizobiaceae bacterium BDR2-2]|uniref:NAD regulator n=2 Tax=Ectorhizobium quercum TaxID=2965071 RepID=A0AAE3N3N9_9HYPH|nr:NAD regulator [Ectorhizobium quercum]MCX8999074.1 NAD regulator [Ectorhizobium quercum]